MLWGGREGYDTLLNTRIGQELDQLGRFLSLVVEHKHKIGFTGTILIEPKPCEPTKHQYDYDAAAVAGFLRKYGLEREVKMNLEVNHATLAGHTFEHELAFAASQGLLGSIDVNRGDPQNGWDTDQFPNSVADMTLAVYHILHAGGLGSGGFNFDAKVRRQSIDPVDLFHAHVGGIDVCARGAARGGEADRGRHARPLVDAALRRLGQRHRRGNPRRQADAGRDRRAGCRRAGAEAEIRAAGNAGEPGQPLR